MEGNVLRWETELKAQEEPVLLQSRVLMNLLLELEERHIPCISYFHCVQTQLQPYMRRMLTSWMLEVCEEQKCGEDVFPLAVNCLDRFLSLVPVEKRHLQLLGSTCLFLASKLRDSTPMTAESLCMYSDYCFTDKELLAMELLVLNKLKWDIEAVTPRQFLPHFLELLVIPTEKRPRVRKLAETFITLCSTDCTFITLPPSMVAAACVAAAVTGLQLQSSGMSYSSVATVTFLAHAIRCEPSLLRTCQEQIEISLESSLQQAQRNRISESKSVEEPERSSTPTDVLDIDL